jgi:hypothetical protein
VHSEATEPPGVTQAIAELRVVEDVALALDEAARLIQESHPEMAVVRAVSSFEVFMKTAFLEPYLRTRVLDAGPELSDVIVDAVLGPQGWRGKLAPMLRSCWDIDVGSMSSWSEVNDAWRIRNKIVHKGHRCSAADATRYVSACETLMRALLVARAGYKAAQVTDQPLQ